MVSTAEVIKLVGILGGGALIIIVGLVVQKKIISNKKKKEEEMYNGMSSSTASNEETAKNYILEYKAQYSKESVKSGLLQMNIPSNEADEYLSKYY